MSDVTERIDDLLKNGDFREATTLAISSLGSSDDQVGIYPLYPTSTCYFRLSCRAGLLESSICLILLIIVLTIHYLLIIVISTQKGDYYHYYYY